MTLTQLPPSASLGVLQGEIENKGFNSEWHRLASYQTWPFNSGAVPSRLARQGFYYTGQDDLVKCFSCGAVVSGQLLWQKHLAGCAVASGMDVSNVTMMPTESARRALSELRRTGHIPATVASVIHQTHETPARPTTNRGTNETPHTGNNPGRKARETQHQSNVVHDVPSSLPPHSHKNEPVRNSSHSIPSILQQSPSVTQPTNPRHPEFEALSARLASFVGWQPGKTQTPTLMATAGFYFAGHSDCVRCFHCHGGLQNWLPPDDPWVEHARWFPRCDFVIQNQGEEFVKCVARGEHVIPRVANVQQVTTKSVALTKAAEPGLHVKAHRSVVQPARLQQQKASTPTTTASSSGDDQGNVKNTTKVSPAKSKKKKRKQTKPRTANSTNAELSKDLEELLKEKQKLEEVNKALQEAERCKVCMDDEICIVFLPCGHRVTCSSCAANMQNCPMCRTFIRGTVKTYLA